LAIFHGRLDGIDLRTSFAPDLPPVNLDREQFQRVVVNLVDNAAEAMQDSLVKNLYVATQTGAADTVELVVADSGCGVSPDEKEKLFLPYFSTRVAARAWAWPSSVTLWPSTTRIFAWKTTCRPARALPSRFQRSSMPKRSRTACHRRSPTPR